MTDPSTPEPIDGPPWPEWTGNLARRCVGHKKNGEQCRRHARRGTNVCDFHGAKAPQVKAKARQRLEEATDRMARELLNMATAEDVSDATKLAAIRDALDRGGVTTKSALEQSATRKPAPWEEIMAEIAFDGIAQITQQESRARRGLSVTPARSTPGVEFVDVELLLLPDGQDGPERAANPAADELRALDSVDLPGDDSAGPTALVAPQPTSVSYEEAAALMRAARVRKAPARRGRRRR
jgi:hypothetical protein